MMIRSHVLMLMMRACRYLRVASSVSCIVCRCVEDLGVWTQWLSYVMILLSLLVLQSMQVSGRRCVKTTSAGTDLQCWTSRDLFSMIRGTSSLLLLHQMII